jgi:hypothetical protein
MLGDALLSPPTDGVTHRHGERSSRHAQSHPRLPIENTIDENTEVDYKLPAEHWRGLRTNNPLERPMGAIRTNTGGGRPQRKTTVRENLGTATPDPYRACVREWFPC